MTPRCVIIKNGRQRLIVNIATENFRITRSTHIIFGYLGTDNQNIIDGVAMAVVAALRSASIGQDIWREPKRIAAIVYGSAALASSGFDPGPVLVYMWLRPQP